MAGRPKKWQPTIGGTGRNSSDDGVTALGQAIGGYVAAKYGVNPEFLKALQRGEDPGEEVLPFETKRNFVSRKGYSQGDELNLAYLLDKKAQAEASQLAREIQGQAAVDAISQEELKSGLRIREDEYSQRLKHEFANRANQQQNFRAGQRFAALQDLPLNSIGGIDYDRLGTRYLAEYGDDIFKSGHKPMQAWLAQQAAGTRLTGANAAEQERATEEALRLPSVRSLGSGATAFIPAKYSPGDVRVLMSPVGTKEEPRFMPDPKTGRPIPMGTSNVPLYPQVTEPFAELQDSGTSGYGYPGMGQLMEILASRAAASQETKAKPPPSTPEPEAKKEEAKPGFWGKLAKGLVDTSLNTEFVGDLFNPDKSAIRNKIGGPVQFAPGAPAGNQAALIEELLKRIIRERRNTPKESSSRPTRWDSPKESIRRKEG